MAKQIDVKYTDRDFNSLKKQLVEFSKNYFPDTYNDFSPTSPGTMYMEMAAYVGDVLSYYQDIQYQESLLQYAQEPANLFSLAYMMGYNPKMTTAAQVELDVYQQVSATSGRPNWTEAVTLTGGTQLESQAAGSTRFYVEDSIDFNYSSSFSPTEVTVYSQDSTGAVNSFLLKKKVKAISGEVETKTFSVGSAQRFLTLALEDSNIIGILKIEDSEGNEWTEVPYLAQGTIFVEDNTTTPATMKLQKTPRRFVTRFTSKGTLQLQFGSGVSTQEDTVITPNPSNVGLGTHYGASKLDVAYDPSNFMYTQEYGLAPANTTLTVTYLSGGGIASNVPNNTIRKIVSLTGASPSDVSFTNPKAATGGKDADTAEEIRQNSAKAYREQLRAVTNEDYVVRSLSMPAKFGSIAKAFAAQDQLTKNTNNTDSILEANPLGVSLYILGYDNEGKLSNVGNLIKKNLQTYLSQYKMITDSINLRDAFIVNIGIVFEIVIRPNEVAREVLLRCNNALRDHFKTTRWNINQSINLSEVYTLLDKVSGVQTVKNIDITNKAGGNYSQFSYDIKGATRDGVVYPSYDPCMFEIKFPETDIIGRVTTI